MNLTEPKALLLLLTIAPVVYLGVLSARARKRDRTRIIASIAIRSLILVLLTLALAGLQWISNGGPLNVVFLVDESASVSGRSHDAAIEYVQKAIGSMGPDDRAGVVLFGEKAIVDRAISGGGEWKPFGKHPAGIATDIADAIQVGGALFPEGGSRRLVLLTDGAETVGKARDLASRAKQSGIQLSVVPLDAQADNEVAVEKVASPNSVPKGQQYEATVLLKSTSERSVSVSLFDGDKKVGQQEMQIKAGETVATFPVQAADEGFRVLRAAVSSVDDRYSENNEASSFTIVRTPPSVLIVSGTPADAGPLEQALKAGGIAVDVVEPDSMPSGLDRLSKYDTVVLANASADAIGVDRQQLLQTYVRDLGHGLVMLGGELSYGAGGYLRSTLEDVLPVTMDVRTSEQRASIAMTFLMDKSGSMGRCHCGNNQQFDPSMRTEFGPSKVEIAKQAIAHAASLLNSSDQVGVVGFDATAHELEKLTPMKELGSGGLQQDLKNIDAAGGPTNLYAGLQSAIDQLNSSSAKLKHIILISDGWTQQADFKNLLGELSASNITLTTVGAGEGPGEVLKDLADKGGGRYYAATNIYNLPDVLLKETVRLAGQYYIEKPLKALVAKDSPILKGLSADSLPPLLGYNATTPKPEADTILKSPDGDPILAAWQYGLGRSVAWTPDMKGRWATDWVTWPQFSQFAGQMVSWTVPQSGVSGLEAQYTVSPSGSAGTQDVSARISSQDAGGRSRTDVQTTLTVTDTAHVSQILSLAQGSPGIYTGVIKGLPPGVYEVGLEQRSVETGELVARDTSGFVVPYSSEYNIVDDSAKQATALLSDVAQLGGGRVLSLTDPAAAFVHDLTSQPLRVPLAPWLLLLAVLLFPLDVATRRLTVSWSDLRRWVRRDVRPGHT
ncbi:MAG: VWA domain-containing protein [Chloroflexota bacterium]